MLRNRIDWVCCIAAVFFFLVSANARAEKDFKGLFGSYKPPKLTENEGKDSDFGINFLLSTLIPITPVVKSFGGVDNLPLESFHFATYYNLEIEPYFTVRYNWEFFGRIGYYTYSTERPYEADIGGGQQATQFHYFNVTMVPVVVGVRKRFGREDVVPYLGVAGGMAYVKQHASYGYNPEFDISETFSPLYEILGGAEFFFGARAGLRIEIGVTQTLLSASTFIPLSNIPTYKYQGNPFSIRYSSGIFVLF